MSYNNNNKDNDESHLRKLFIGGLNMQTTNESLTAFYSKWGAVADCKIVMDANSGRSKCYAFLTFADAECLDRCMQERPHVVDGKQVDPKRAMPRKEVQNSETKQRVKKIFIGGLKDLTVEEVKEYFSKYGKVTAFDIVTDKATGKARGFGFLAYEDTDSVDKTVLLKYHNIRDVRVEVKKAVERDGKRGQAGGRVGMHPPNNVPVPQGAYGRQYAFPPEMQGEYAQWNMSQMWNQWYTGTDAGTGYALGSGYANAQGGGVMRGNGHANRLATAPYQNANGNHPYASAPYDANAFVNPYGTSAPSALPQGGAPSSVPQSYGSNANAAAPFVPGAEINYAQN